MRKVSKTEFVESRIAQTAARFDPIKGKDPDGYYRARFYDGEGTLVAYTQSEKMCVGPIEYFIA